MKSTEVLLAIQILTDVGIMCNTSVDRDIQTLVSRVEDEGESFLTITLPEFGKAFFACLELGYCDHTLFPAFSKRGVGERLIPKFLWGITSQVFDVEGDLRIKDNASVDAIDGIRQVAYAFNKTKQECSDARKRKALCAYLKCESDLRSFRYQTWESGDDFRRLCRLMFGGVLNGLQRELLAGDLVPKHGPGAVVEGTTGNGKFRLRNWTQRLERAMPSDRYLYCNAVHTLSDGMVLDILAAELEQPVKVIFVPKTQKSPRVIAIEPIHMQYTQQAFLVSLVKSIELDPFVGQSIHFSDATINGSLALENSRTQKLATLDLSEASDRVHGSLVYNMLRDYPELAQAIFACRSKYATLPGGLKFPLVKFASMGSALCFPMESMVFFIIALLGVLKTRNLPFTYASVKRVIADIHVYGDDILIPVDACRFVCNALESAGLRVNYGKTFSRSKFRESCGVDAYDGHNVTPVYVRTKAPIDKQDVSALVSYVETSNLFYKKGYWKSAAYMRSVISARVGPLPHVLDTSPLLGYWSFLGSYSVGRWNKELARFETKGFTTSVKKRSDPLNEYDRLLKFFLTSPVDRITDNTVVREPLGEEDSFDKSVVRGSLYAKSRWCSPF